MQTKRVINIGYFGAAAVALIFFRQLSDAVWRVARLPVLHDWPISPADLIGAVAAAALFVILKKNERVNTFINDVVLELSKVTWPQRKETVLSTGVIIVMVAISVLILFVFDVLLGTVVRLLFL